MAALEQRAINRFNSADPRFHIGYSVLVQMPGLRDG